MKKGEKTLTTASILNNVIGPVMPGCSSSHTAGPYHISKFFRAAMGGTPEAISFTFEPESSLAATYNAQGSDLAFIIGALGLEITDPRFKDAFNLAGTHGMKVAFKAEHFDEACHPNSTKIEAVGKDGRTFSAVADSTGGGALLFRHLFGWPVEITGDAYYVFAEAEERAAEAVHSVMSVLGASRQSAEGKVFFAASLPSAPRAEILEELKKIDAINNVTVVPPVFYALKGERLFASACEMVDYAESKGISLGEAALDYESCLLGLDRAALNAEMDRRLQVMLDAVELGLSEESPAMFLLENRARSIMEAERAGALALGGVHTRAAARAMAAMEVNSGQGIVCAAPTAGSAGVIPGVMATMIEDMKADRKKVLEAMWAAGAIGLVLATRGTFAAEVCGCQVEIGAAGAMGAGAVVDAAGGSARQAADAAAIMFQNAMGLVCDLVQGIVEIPCHTRNGSFASQAFICADMILGGYKNSVNLDDTVDAVCATGRMLPPALLCTSLGGMAATPSAQAIPKAR